MALRFNARTGAISVPDSTVTFPAATTSAASINLPHGTTPMTPNDGDIWTTTTTIFARINGVTEDLLAGTGDVSATGTPVNNQLAVWTNATTIEGDANLTWDGSLLDVNGAADFSSTITIAGQISGATALHQIAATPYHLLRDTNASANQGGFIVQSNAGLRIRAATDALDNFTDALVITRSDQTITEVELNATTLDFNGTADFSGAVTVNGTANINNILTVSSAAPRIVVNDTSGAGVDETNWIIGGTNGILTFATATDAAPSTIVENAVRLLRSGTAATEIELNATTLDFNGTADFSGAVTVNGGNLEVFGATQSNFYLIDSDGASDAKRWRFVADGGVLSLMTRTDANGTGATPLRVLRTGTDVSDIELVSTRLLYTGARLAVSTTSGPYLWLVDTDATLAHGWRMRSNSNTLTIASTNASDTAIATAITLTGNDSTITQVRFDGTEIELNGALDFNGAADFSSSITAATNIMLDGTAGSFIFSNDTNSGLGWSSADTIFLATGGAQRLTVSNSEIDLTATTLDFNGTLSADTSAANTVGYLGAPSTDVSASTNTSAANTGQTIRFTGGSGQTYTLDSDPPEDAVIIFDNASGASWTIAASGTLIWASDGSTGNRTLADDGLAVALHRGSGVWIINGGGLS